MIFPRGTTRDEKDSKFCVCRAVIFGINVSSLWQNWSQSVITNQEHNYTRESITTN